MVNKRHLVLANWIDKQTGKPKSNLGEIKEGIGKENGNPYQITETKKRTS